MTTLLQTKLTIPTIRPALVARGRLWQRLAAVPHSKLILLSAPAGFGKTTLLAAYAARVAADDTALAWLSLDEDDNDPARYWAYLLGALASAGVELSAEATAVATNAPNLIITDVVNELTAVLTPNPDSPLMLVLDDYHLIQNRIIHEAITFLLEHMPPRMHLILAARADPPLPLARWRARSQLTELRLDELRFTENEADDFLRQMMGLPLSTSDVTVLNERIEGWIAGLQMAAVSLQGRAAAWFGAINRHILYPQFA